MHLMAAATLNSYEAGQFETSLDEPWHKGSPASLGCTFKPAIALLNHSCNPNTIRYNIGHATVLVAATDISKGDEVLYIYPRWGLNLGRIMN